MALIRSGLYVPVVNPYPRGAVNKEPDSRNRGRRQALTGLGGRRVTGRRQAGKEVGGRWELGGKRQQR